MEFKLQAKFKPTGDQPQAIEKLTANLKNGVADQVLLGVTGSGKTFSLANVIEKAQRSTLIISPNKTLAAQLYQEFKEFFPENAVHYFVSYYDYYQPEAYLPQTDTYIEKDVKINEQIDHLRHAAVQDLLLRKDTIVIASVSCIYNLGSPQNYQKVALEIKVGQKMKRNDFLGRLIDLQYLRNDIDFTPGTFKVQGDLIEVNLITGEQILKIEFSGNRIERLTLSKGFPSTNYLLPTTNLPAGRQGYTLFPANFWVTEEAKMKIALKNIKTELAEQVAFLEKKGKLLEAQRLTQRTNYDLEMMQETGICSGIENYSSHLEFRKPKEPPFTLLDYFKKVDKNFLTIIDESHIAIPQLHAMYNTDKARKNVLIEHGFRLPSALDNRPLSFEEFEGKVGQIIYSSATPGPHEIAKSKEQKANGIIEQLVRPTGLLEPTIEIKPLENQVKDLIKEIKKAKLKGSRTLAITLTKKMAEELSSFLKEEGINAQYLHSDIKTLERPLILQQLREGKFDVLVGVNLLREGLDLPEVSLIGILDADKEGFLRNKTTLVQTMGRAARHLEGHCILYADKITLSIKTAQEEINRRREVQVAYNKKHRITPQAINKSIQTWGFKEKERGVLAEFGSVNDMKLLKKEMEMAARHLDFERAAEIKKRLAKINNSAIL
ncbi:MAG: excinuclease ABC subunit UvrB [bacterium]|nr:excinuclease ABC subunit UvrB [bacterium]